MDEQKDVTFDEVAESTLPEFKWLDISSEAWRAYTFPDDRVVTVIEPVALSLTTMSTTVDPPLIGGGSHRIVDRAGQSHYIPRGWILLTWRSCPFYGF